MGIVLASNSPRRQLLLKKITKTFEVFAREIDETHRAEEKPREYVERMAREKGEAIFPERPEDIILSSDTSVVADGEILGKPKDKEDARRMLELYSGKTHQVMTSVAIRFREESEVFTSVCDVEFYEMTAAEIDNYISTDEPYDKAGAYAIQGGAALFIKKIHGDYNTIVGFPIAEIYHRLPRFFELEKEFAEAKRAQLRDKLTKEEFAITQDKETEHAFTGKYDNFYEEGIYVDVTNGVPLFSSTDKYDAGCGWPAFTKPIEGKRVTEKIDKSFGMTRTEVKSGSSHAHLGHVFTDGPQEFGGNRFCINSAALKFIPKNEMEAAGYGEYLDLFK
jgi:peptide-methionine (R)-S-oxide reductase